MDQIRQEEIKKGARLGREIQVQNEETDAEEKKMGI